MNFYLKSLSILLDFTIVVLILPEIKSSSLNHFIINVNRSPDNPSIFSGKYGISARSGSVLGDDNRNRLSEVQVNGVRWWCGVSGYLVICYLMTYFLLCVGCKVSAAGSMFFCWWVEGLLLFFPDRLTFCAGSGGMVVVTLFLESSFLQSTILGPVFLLVCLLVLIQKLRLLGDSLDYVVVVMLWSTVWVCACRESRYCPILQNFKV